MPVYPFLPMLANKIFTLFGFAIALYLSPLMLATAAGQGSAAQLLKEGNSYQTVDDTGDRAAEAYRIIIQKYPKTSQAEQAQYFLGTYYHKKFYILEHKNNIQDWSSFNQAEDALYSYIGKYSNRGTQSYLADAYHTLAMIALRRGYRESATKLLNKMSEAGTQDKLVYISKVVWSPREDDIIRGYCPTESLVAASLDSVNRFSNFNDLVNDLGNWSRKNCK